MERTDPRRPQAITTRPGRELIVTTVQLPDGREARRQNNFRYRAVIAVQALELGDPLDGTWSVLQWVNVNLHPRMDRLLAEQARATGNHQDVRVILTDQYKETL